MIISKGLKYRLETMTYKERQIFIREINNVLNSIKGTFGHDIKAMLDINDSKITYLQDIKNSLKTALDPKNEIEHLNREFNFYNNKLLTPENYSKKDLIRAKNKVADISSLIVNYVEEMKLVGDMPNYLKRTYELSKIHQNKKYPNVKLNRVGAKISTAGTGFKSLENSNIPKRKLQK